MYAPTCNCRSNASGGIAFIVPVRENFRHEYYQICFVNKKRGCPVGASFLRSIYGESLSICLNQGVVVEVHALYGVDLDAGDVILLQGISFAWQVVV